MTIWLDNQLPPALAPWVRATLGLGCTPIRSLNLHRASDLDIFHAARAAGATVFTKDADFAALVATYGAPPQVVLVTCGNTTNERLRALIRRSRSLLTRRRRARGASPRTGVRRRPSVMPPPIS